MSPRCAQAAPAWFALVNLPSGDSGFAFLAASAQTANDHANNAAPTASGISNEELCDTLVSSARESGLPVTFFTRLIWQESRFDSGTVSRAGAEGIAQFMPTMAREVGLENPLDPRQAIPAAAQLLRTLVDKFGNVGLAAAAYNAGAERVRAWIARRSRLPAETRQYVVSVTGRTVDTWRDVKPVALAFAVPSDVPCNSIETFAAAMRNEQAQAVEPIAHPVKVAAAAHTPTPRRRRHERARTAALKLHGRARTRS